ncbi:DUF4412 domain-containing protein [Parvibaculum sp.]|uniref:DUF4412 domain-containing protein n=1 Tax=Parvibaculum sp. TaxID=2024848 RepID=UPI001DD7C116|nr:DUF4412 domain-containing protein [Parvibaculum sp.]MBX3490193.1 DUF4412 domain-containing protein [Parvibaculum sp.]MCW5725817.1 DUF4412 domain-containing protein [Parvibaculum sp.]
MRLILFTALFVAVVSIQPASAATLTPPDTAYSAVRTVEAQGMTMNSKVYYDRGTERWETTMQGVRQVTILLPDEKKMLMYMPDMNMAMEMNMDDVADYGIGEIYDEGIEAEKLGEEAVEGEQTTKYRIDRAEDAATVFVWLTRDGIPVKAEGASPAGKFAMTLSELQRGAQDAALFRLPDGVTATKMPAGMPPSTIPR